MASLMVFDMEEGTRVPFLRGILTRSLQNSGLPFRKAYKLANTIRDELGDVTEITNVELRKRVSAHLLERSPELAARYEAAGGPGDVILVRSPGEETAPYSRGRHRLDLLSSGLSPEEAASVVAHIFRQLTEEGAAEVEIDRLGELTREAIERELGAEAAERYLVWQRYEDGDRPLIVFVGGTVGTGKSTVSTELARRLGIVRIQSTDMLREVMRTLIPKRVLPVLHTSSYSAWKAVPAPNPHDKPSEDLLAEGYLSQSEPVSVACEAVVARAMKERLPLILEGVHVNAGWLSRIAQYDGAIIVPIMLAVLSKKQLKKRIKGRGKQAPDRRAERYLANFDAIWQLQSFVLSEADQAGLPIIFNEDLESTVHAAMGTVLEALSRHYAGDRGVAV